MAAPMALQLSTRRGRLRALLLESAVDSGRYQLLLSEQRVLISGFYDLRGRWAECGRTHGRMAACGMRAMRRVGDVG